MRQTRPSARATTPSARPDQSRPPSSLVSWLAGAARREPSAEGGRRGPRPRSRSRSRSWCAAASFLGVVGSGGVLSFPYVAIKSGARSPTPSLARSFSFFFSGIPLLQQNRGKKVEGSAAAAGTHAGGRGRVTFSDCRKQFVRSFVVRSFLRCSAFIRESISRSTSDSETAKFRGRRSVYVSLSSSTSTAAPLLFPTAPKLTMQT